MLHITSCNKYSNNLHQRIVQCGSNVLFSTCWLAFDYKRAASWSLDLGISVYYHVIKAVNPAGWKHLLCAFTDRTVCRDLNYADVCFGSINVRKLPCTITCFRSISASSRLSSSLCRALFLHLATCCSFCALSINVDVNICVFAVLSVHVWHLSGGSSLPFPYTLSLSLFLSVQWQLASAFPPTDQLSTLTRGIWIVCMCACVTVRECVHARMCVSVWVWNKRAALFFVGVCVCLLFTRFAGRKQSDTHRHTLWGLGNYRSGGSVRQKLCTVPLDRGVAV